MEANQTDVGQGARRNPYGAPEIEYAASMLTELQNMAAAFGTQAEMLAYLISMARQEATRLAQGSGAARPEDAGWLSGDNDTDRLDERMANEHAIDWWREQLDLISGPDG
ncbi:MAG: hypothetical protein AAF141_07510 [Pseudomonadota bacterium]